MATNFFVALILARDRVKNNFFHIDIYDRNQFVMEYSGEVMGYEEFEKRVEMYDRDNRRHYYFMTLRADEVSWSTGQLAVLG